MPAYMNLNRGGLGAGSGPLNAASPRAPGGNLPMMGLPQGPMGGANPAASMPGAAPRPSAGRMGSAVPARIQGAPQAATQGLAVSGPPTQYGTGRPEPIPVSAGQRQQWADEQGHQDRANANYDDARRRQTEIDMTNANRQMAANMGGEISGQYGYVYPPGGGSRNAAPSGSGGSGGGDGGGKQPFDIDAAIARFTQAMPTIQPPPQVAPPQVPQASGMFAHAKDVSGRVGNKALDAFRNIMTKRGMSGSGMEAEGEAGILGQVATQQSGAEYDQANLNNERQWDANKLGYQGNMGQNAMGYQGGITQRGQGIQALLQLIGMGARY